ncbi:MAG: ArsR family transcriptional regulator [Desulfobulbaceae bacterium]|nr:ArsR family transcriptional regulator [Desulfobulbaceae bacterium]
MLTTAEIFKSLADETRLRILILAPGKGKIMRCDLMHALDMPHSTVSHHLAYLKRRGVLQEPVGRRLYVLFPDKRDGRRSPGPTGFTLQSIS